MPRLAHGAGPGENRQEISREEPNMSSPMRLTIALSQGQACA